DVVRELLPAAGPALDLALSLHDALPIYLLGHAGDLGGEGAQLIDHRVDGVLELEDLAARVDGDLLRQVAVGDRRRDERDVADLDGGSAHDRAPVPGHVRPASAAGGNLGL